MEELQVLTRKINRIDEFVTKEASTLSRIAIFYIQKQLGIMKKRKTSLEKLHLT